MTGIHNSSAQERKRKNSVKGTLRHMIQFAPMILFIFVWLFCAGASQETQAAPGDVSCHATGSECSCATDLEPNLITDAQNGGTGTAGFDIVNAVFQTINDIMASMEATFYNNLIGQATYQNAINALVILYVTIYGILILFNMAPARAGEVVGRLFKIGILWFLVGANGWMNFQECVSDPVINTINALITQFSAAGEGGAGITDAISTGTGQCGSGVAGTPAGGALSSAAMKALFGPMTLIFSTTFAVVLIALLSTPVGWFMAMVIIWGVVEFFFMLLGAVLTYIKGLVGLAFLFALAPIFLAFILFAKTKQIFFGWVNQLVGFFLTPVLLFAFLGFYSNLLLAILQSTLFPTPAMNPTVGQVNYCWVTFFKWAIFDFKWWRPVDEYIDPASGATNHEPNSCANLCDNGGDWEGPPPIGIVEVLYFLLLTHLGKNLSHFIEQIAKDISGGSTPGVVRSDTVGRWFSNAFLGGRGPGGIARSFMGGAVSAAQGAVGGARKLGGALAARGRGAGTGSGGGGSGRGALGKVGHGAGKVGLVGLRAALHPISAAKAAGRATAKGATAAAQGTRKAAVAVAQAPGKASRAVGHGVMQTGRGVASAAGAVKRAPGQAYRKAASEVNDAKAAVKGAVSDINKATRDAARKGSQAAQAARDTAAKKARQARKAISDARDYATEKGVGGMAGDVGRKGRDLGVAAGKAAGQAAVSAGKSVGHAAVGVAHDARDATVERMNAAVSVVQDTATKVRTSFETGHAFGGFDDKWR